MLRLISRRISSRSSSSACNSWKGSLLFAKSLRCVSSSRALFDEGKMELSLEHQMLANSILASGANAMSAEDAIAEGGSISNLVAERTALKGHIINRRDGVITVIGLDKARRGSLVKFSNGGMGYVVDILKTKARIAILSSKCTATEGDVVECTNIPILFPVGAALTGRIVNALGEPLDNQGALKLPSRDMSCLVPLLQSKSIPLPARALVKETFSTGVKALDVLHPIGFGNRVAIIGQRGSGKTTLATSIIGNQGPISRSAGLAEPPRCIYVMVGMSNQQRQTVVTQLTESGAMDYTTIVASNPSDSYAMQYLTPLAGSALADHFRSQGQNVVVVYDDMYQHAEACNQMMAFMQTQGYQIPQVHASFLDRAGCFTEERGGGSVTVFSCVSHSSAMLPSSPGYMTSALAADASRSIVDEIIEMDEKLAMRRMFPAVSMIENQPPLSKSISTYPYMRPLLASIRRTLNEASTLTKSAELKREYKIFVEDDEAEESRAAMKMQYFFKQDAGDVRHPAALAVLLFAIENGHTKGVPASKAYTWEAGLWPYLMQHVPQVALELSSLSSEDALPDHLAVELFWAVEKYCAETSMSGSSAAAKSRVGNYFGTMSVDAKK